MSDKDLESRPSRSVALTAVGDAQISPSSPWPMLCEEISRSPASPSGEVGRSIAVPGLGDAMPSGDANLGLKA